MEGLPIAEHTYDELEARAEELLQDPEFIAGMAANMQQAREEGIENATPLDQLL